MTHQTAARQRSEAEGDDDEHETDGEDEEEDESEEYEKASWYVAEASREQLRGLRDKPAGSFLVHKSKMQAGAFCISAWNGDFIWTGLIINSKNGASFQLEDHDKCFAKLSDLIHYFAENVGPAQCKLNIPGVDLGSNTGSSSKTQSLPSVKSPKSSGTSNAFNTTAENAHSNTNTESRGHASVADINFAAEGAKSERKSTKQPPPVAVKPKSSALSSPSASVLSSSVAMPPQPAGAGNLTSPSSGLTTTSNIPISASMSGNSLTPTINVSSSSQPAADAGGRTGRASISSYNSRGGSMSSMMSASMSSNSAQRQTVVIAADGRQYECDEYGGYYDENGLYYDADGGYYDENGLYYDSYGGYYDENGYYYDANGGYYDENGQYYDCEGNPCEAPAWPADSTHEQSASEARATSCTTAASSATLQVNHSGKTLGKGKATKTQYKGQIPEEEEERRGEAESEAFENFDGTYSGTPASTMESESE